MQEAVSIVENGRGLPKGGGEVSRRFRLFDFLRPFAFLDSCGR